MCKKKFIFIYFGLKCTIQMLEKTDKSRKSTKHMSVHCRLLSCDIIFKMPKNRLLSLNLENNYSQFDNP